MEGLSTQGLDGDLNREREQRPGHVDVVARFHRV